MKNKTIDQTDSKACRHKGSGPSSFWMQDPGMVFDQLALQPGMHFLDLGCGRGDYSLEAARRVSPRGLVTALDVSGFSVRDLTEATSNLGIKNLKAMTADITRCFPIKDSSADVCFLSTVLHIPQISRYLGDVLKEVARVLKPEGRFIVLECKKEEWDFGPPVEMKWSPKEVYNAIRNYGFQKIGFVEFQYNYCIQFTLQKLKEGRNIGPDNL